MCYPQYKAAAPPHFKRMKPPLTLFRLGDLYNNPVVKSGGGLTGFIKTLNYTVPDSSPWEHANGKTVPKHVSVAINYQVIHDVPPNITTMFNGYVGTTGVADLEELT